MKKFKTILNSMSFVFVALIFAGLIMPLKSYAIPIADAGGPYTVEAGMSVTFDASGSSTGGTSEIIGWDWDLDNDGEYDDAFGETVPFNTGSMAVGTYVIGLKVTDWTNGTHGEFGYDYDTAYLFITDAEPVPEPATMILFGTGLAGLVGYRLRSKKR